MKASLGEIKPNEKQKLFFSAKQRFVAYGGARGGGKSWAVQRKAEAMALTWDGIRILILRHTFPELQENHIRPMQSHLRGIAKFSKQDKAFEFPNGSIIKFGYCDSDSDIEQYQGVEYDIIFLDEATQFREELFLLLAASLRGANNFPKRFYLTCNPGGVGHAWVKRLFVDRDFRPDENPDDYIFIQATYKDNPVLLEKDPGYVHMLETLPPSKRAAWLEGKWDVFEGQFFPEWNPEVHVVKRFPIPDHWQRFFAMDYGMDMLAGYWAATDEQGRIYLYREVYRPGLILSEAATLIKEMSGNEAIMAWWVPPDVWGKSRAFADGRDLQEIMSDYGVYPSKVSNDRVRGWLDLKEYLKLQPDGKPKLMVLEGTCPNLCESMPYMIYSQRDPNDSDTEPHKFTHAPDAIRYLVAGRPWASRSVDQLRQDEDDECDNASYDDQLNSFLMWGG